MKYFFYKHKTTMSNESAIVDKKVVKMREKQHNLT